MNVLSIDMRDIRMEVIDFQKGIGNRRLFHVAFTKCGTTKVVYLKFESSTNQSVEEFLEFLQHAYELHIHKIIIDYNLFYTIADNLFTIIVATKLLPRGIYLDKSFLVVSHKIFYIVKGNVDRMFDDGVAYDSYIHERLLTAENLKKDLHNIKINPYLWFQ